MANPLPAFPNTDCDGCSEEIPEGDSVYFNDGEKLCEDCAADGDYVCDCGNFKKSEYDTCYECR